MKTHEITYKEPETKEECSFVECFECIIPIRDVGECAKNCFCPEKLCKNFCRKVFN